MLSRLLSDRVLIWRAVILFVLGSALVGDAAMAAGIAAKHAFFSDFAVFWTAAHARPEAIYDVAQLTRAQGALVGAGAGPRPFAYPPSFIPWIQPFGALPYWPALAAWTAVGLGSFAAASTTLARRASLAFTFLSPMVFLVLIAGQATFLVAACLIGGVVCAKTRPIIAGALIGLAATMKPQAVALAPLALVAGRHWRPLAAAAATGLAIGLLSLAIEGPPLWRAWLGASVRFLTLAKSNGYVGIGVTPSTLAALLGLKGFAADLLIAAGALLGAACVWVVFHWTEGPAPRLAALVAGCLLCAPYALDYELAAVAPAAAVMLFDRTAPRTSWVAAALAFTGAAGALSVVALAVSLLWTYWPRRSAKSAPGAAASPAASGEAPSTAEPPS